MIVVALQKLIFFMVFSPVISVLYLVGNIMENSDPLPGSETKMCIRDRLRRTHDTWSLDYV